MLGVFFGLASAVANAAENVMIKSREFDPCRYSFYNRFAGILVLLPLIAVLGMTLNDNRIWYLLPVFTVIDSFAGFLYIRAIQISGIGLTVPFLSLTPVFVMFLSFFFLGESPTPRSFLAIIFIAIGAYLLNLSKGSKGFLEPIKSIYREKGSLLMLIAAIIFSFTGTMFKIGTVMTDALTWLTLILVAESIAFFIVSPKKGIVKQGLENWKFFLLAGLLISGGGLALAAAMKIMFASYAVALKRTTVLFSVIFGFLFFKETNIRDKILGSSVMLVGVVMLSLS